MTRTREWLLLNAVEAWLHHYSKPPSETVAQYKKLRDELHDTFMASIQPKDAQKCTQFYKIMKLLTISKTESQQRLKHLINTI